MEPTVLYVHRDLNHKQTSAILYSMCTTERMNHSLYIIGKCKLAAKVSSEISIR